MINVYLNNSSILDKCLCVQGVSKNSNLNSKQTQNIICSFKDFCFLIKESRLIQLNQDDPP